MNLLNSINSVKLRLKNLLSNAERSQAIEEEKWAMQPQYLPWLDRPNAKKLLAAKYKSKAISSQEYEWLRQWIDEGYFVVDDAIDRNLLNPMIADLDNLWYADEPIPGVIIHNLGLDKDSCRDYTHAEVLSLEQSVREQMRDNSNWRIHELYKISENARQIFYSPTLAHLASLVLGKESHPKYSISFHWGSGQFLHQDMAVFHIFPLNYLLGVWVAAEDISPDSGPLVFYPGSHKEKMYEKFDNYPQTNLRTADKETFHTYIDSVNQVAKKYERKEFIAKKGQALFWHGMLIHGGGRINNPSLTRRSFVIHYTPEGVDRATEIEGPFNW
ncbi:MAG TPA: phytanoyl-CoA dioxygenase [Cyanobacteria bacterium UBA11369]|nr:phytanoyl-CoA dioxygenase [Cyanobacteria bacterium UBA11371]HBE47700.1 phytanoyl-CoA dioxygenase [Cyanobacteria bacterium UBA11369]